MFTITGIFLIISFSLHKLWGFCNGEYRDTYFVLGCLKAFNFLTEQEQPKVENQTQKITLKIFL